MKIMKLLFSIVCIVFSVVHVNAADGVLNPGSFSMECVYDSGISIEAYNEGGVYGLSSSTFKLSNAVTPPSVSNNTFFYDEAGFSKSILDNATCPEYVYYMVVYQYNDSGSVSFPVYAAPKDFHYLWTSPEGKYDEAFFRKRVIAGFEPTGGYALTFTVDKGTALESKNSVYHPTDSEDTIDIFIFHFNLVSETFHFNEEVEPIKKWAFKSEGQQAASKTMYVRILEYTTANEQKIQIAQKEGVNTSVNISSRLFPNRSSQVQFICFKASVKSIKSGNDMAYAFSSVRHDYSFKDYYSAKDFQERKERILANLSCPSGYALYSEISWYDAIGDNEESTSICDVIPNTVITLAKVISWLQIIVPILLIGLIGFDIAKIVISGNLEEELPKKKKQIIIRIIVAIVFFFLPVIVQIITSSAYGVDFGDVDCLW